jgi:DNA replication licensing factor MCM4
MRVNSIFRLRDLSIRFEDFIKTVIFTQINFSENENRLINNKYIYDGKIEIKLSELAKFDPILYFNTIESPGLMLGIFDLVIDEYSQKQIQINNLYFEFKNYKISLSGKIESNLNIFDLPEPKYLDKLISIQGIVVAVGDIMSDLISAFFKCEICCFETYSFIENGVIQEPTYCYCCKNFNTFQILYDRCQFDDKKFLKIRSKKKYSEVSDLYQDMKIVISNKYFNYIELGEEIKITGIYRIVQYQRKLYKFASFRLDTYIEAVNIEKRLYSTMFTRKTDISKKRASKNFLRDKLKNTKIDSLFQNPKLYKLLCSSFLKETYGLDGLKKSLFLTLFVFFCKKFHQRKSNFQDNLNLLFVIDKETSFKHNVLEFLNNFDNNLVFLDGKNIEKEKLFYDYNIKNDRIISSIKKGQLVGIKGKILYIDNLNFAPLDIISFIQEATDFGSMTISKAGLNFSITSFFSTIGILNSEKNSTDLKTWRDSLMNIKENFDLVFDLKNNNSEIFDKKYAEHLIDYTYFFEKSNFKEKYLGLGFRLNNLKKVLINFRSTEPPCFNEISKKEMMRIGFLFKNMIKFLQKKDDFEYESKFGTLVLISKLLSVTRMSSAIGLDDMRNALSIIIESLVSD